MNPSNINKNYDILLKIGVTMTHLMYFWLFPSKDMQIPPPPPQFCSHFYDTCAQCWIEWKINFPIFYFFSYGWLYLQFTDNAPEFSSVLPTKQIIQKRSDFCNFYFLLSILFINFRCWKNVQICMKDAQCSRRMKNQFSDFYFLRYGRFCTEIE